VRDSHTRKTSEFSEVSDMVGAKSGAVGNNPNDLALILLSIAELPAEQKQALAKLLAPAAEKLP
jgi:hypothetical protein